MKSKYSALLALFFLGCFLVSCKKDGVGSKKETVIYETDFSKDDGKWYLGAGNYGKSSIENGYYNFWTTSDWTAYNHIAPLFTSNSSNAAVETSIKLIKQGTSGDGSGGLMWGYQESVNSSGYFFRISYDGHYTILGYSNGFNNSSVIYVDWKQGAVKQNQFNKLRIELRDGKLHFLINNVEVHSMASTASSGLDRLGLLVDNGSQIQADYFKAVELR